MYRVKFNLGCDKCKDGIIGRVPVMEYLTKSEMESQSGIKPKRTFRDEYEEKANKGLIDIKEVLNFERYN